MTDTCDPFEDARKRLFPPLRNKTLALAADALRHDPVDVAEALISRVLEKNPHNPDALNLKAELARRTKRFDEAEHLLWQCVDISGNHAGYRFNLAIILRRREKYSQALAQLDLLLVRDPRSPLFREQKATVLSLLDRHAEALLQREHLAAEFPQSPDVWLQYGDALKAVGDEDECVVAYCKALEFERTFTIACQRLAALKTYRFTAMQIVGMEQRAASPGLSAEERADLHHALGKAYDDAQQRAKAFDNYARANALLRLRTEYNVENLGAHRLNCEATFTTNFFSVREGWGSNSKEPIFIVGMPRSGSTLLEQMLCSHSAIEGVGERPDLDNAVGRLMSQNEGHRPEHEFWIGGHFEFRPGLLRAFQRVMTTINAAEVQLLARSYLESIRAQRHSDRPFFVDKGLRNFGYVGLVHLAMPHAKILDMRRHPLDCGWSCFRSHFPGGQPFASRLTDIGHCYADYVRLMQHFDRVLPGRVYRIFYEALVADPAAELRRIFDHLNLPFEDQCLRFHENARFARTISSQQVRKPLNKSGVGQWLPYEEWLGPLKAALGETLHQYPYPPY